MEFPQQPQQQRPAGDGKITYPLGVKEITDKITNDEVVKRLKVRAKVVTNAIKSLESIYLQFILYYM